MTFKRLCCLCLTSVILLSMTSCTRNQKKTADEKVLDITTKVCDAIIDGKYDVIKEHSIYDEDKLGRFSKTMDYFYKNPSWTRDEKIICKKIYESLEYRIDKQSVSASASKEKGTVDVLFTYIDYLSALDEYHDFSIANFDVFLDDFDKTKTVRVQFKYVYDDYEWIIEDIEKIMIDIFSWKNGDFDWTIDFDEYIESVQWLGASGVNNDEFYGVYELHLQIVFESTTTDTSLLEAEVYKDGVYLGQTYSYAYSKDELILYYYSNYYECIPCGEYTFKVYDYMSNFLFEEHCTVLEDDFSYISHEQNDTHYGDSYLLNDISSVSWYLSDPDIIEMDMWTYDDDITLNYFYVVYDEYGQSIYESELISDYLSVAYSEVIVYPDMCGLNEFEVGCSYVIEVYDDYGDFVLDSTVTIR